MFDYISSYICLLFQKRILWEGKLSTVCYARLIFSCGEIIIENIHSWVSKLLPLDVKEKNSILFYLIDPLQIQASYKKCHMGIHVQYYKECLHLFLNMVLRCFSSTYLLIYIRRTKEETEVSHILFDYRTSYSYIRYIFLLLVKIRNTNFSTNVLQWFGWSNLTCYDPRLELINSSFVMLGC